MHVIAARMQARRGRAAEAAAFVTNARDIVSRAADRPASAWQIALGAPTGGFVISGRADGIADWLSASGKMALDPEYQALDGFAAEVLDGPTLTQFNEVIAATSAEEEPKQFISVTSASVVGGQYGTAGGWGAEMLQLVTDITGMGGLLTSAAAGEFGQLSWLLGADTAEELDDANAKLAADPSYLAKLDTSGGLFVEGSGARMVLVRMP